MKKVFFAVITAFLIVSCGTESKKDVQGQDSASIVQTENGKSDNVATNASMPTILDFSASWCPPCQDFKPIFAGASEKYGENIAFRTIDVDAENELAQQYNVTSIPTIVFLDADGKEVNRFVGFRGAEEFEQLIKDAYKLK